MIIATCLFYLFSILAIIGALTVISVKNPVHSVLALILTFFSSAGLFLLMGAEFIAMVLIIVYVGAVAVLFLFVVMMLNINLAKMKENYIKYLPFAFPIILVLITDFYLLFKTATFQSFSYIKPTIPISASVTNTHAIGKVLYTNYIYPFQISGLILLVAMISSIVLTLRRREGIKKQNIYRQLDRNKENSMEVVKVDIKILGEKNAD
ncbi:MAG: NADH-quinone oxidoreductase subunit J [Alphaproteobacteria bacterium]